MTNVGEGQKLPVSFGAAPGQAQEPTVPVVDGEALPKEGEPKFVTPEELTDAMEQVYRKAQSLVDKTGDRFAQRVQELEAKRTEMAAKGQPVSDDAFNALIEQERMNELASTGEQAAQPGAGEQPDQAVIDETNRKADEIWKKHGLEDGIGDDDPEAGLLNHDTPEMYLQTAEAAALVKANRLKGDGVETDPDQVAARIPSLGGAGTQSNPIENITDPNELLALHWDSKKR